MGHHDEFRRHRRGQGHELAVVAPGIAEALAATAYGLAAAIPASVGYNRIGAAFSRAGRAMANLIEEWAVALVAEGRRP